MTDTIPVDQAALDSLTDLWSDDSFSSTIDGQPRSPSGAEITGDLWWERRHEGSQPLRMAFVPSYTPPWPGIWRSGQIGIPISLRWDGDGPEVRQIGIFWQQRWFASVEDGLSIGSYLEANLLTGQGNSGASLTAAGVVARVLGPGVGYLNGALTVASRDASDSLFFLAAYKLILSNSSYLHLGTASTFERGQRGVNLLEISPAFEFGDQLSISPGVAIGLGHREVTPRWTIGLALKWDF